jgi:Flp pilus assembly pilin Flp
MSRILKNPVRIARHSGHATVEYAIIAGLLAVCLFAAVSPAGQMLAQAIRTFYSTLTFYVSLP